MSDKEKAPGSLLPKDDAWGDDGDEGGDWVPEADEFMNILRRERGARPPCPPPKVGMVKTLILPPEASQLPREREGS